MTPEGVLRLARLFLIKEWEYGSRYLMALEFRERFIDQPHNGYFDESLKDDIVGVAGWIGSYEGWNRLEDEWRRVLPKEAKGDFHYTDFWARAKHSYGQDWSDERRLEHVKNLARIAHDCTSFAVGFVFSKRSFDDIIPPEDKKILKGPLHFCFAQCLAMLIGAKTVRQILPPTPWDIMFDRKKEERDGIGRIFLRTQASLDEENMLGNLGFGDRKHMAALQAADLLVGELRRGQAGHPSDILEILREKRPIFVSFPTDDEFREYNKDIQRRIKEKNLRDPNRKHPSLKTL